MMNRKVQLSAIAFLSTVMGIGAAFVSYMAAVLLTPPVTEILSFGPAVSDRVQRGGVLSVHVTYRKNTDCPGVVLVNLDDAGPETETVVSERRLGNREPGEWSIIRRYDIPADATPGPATLQEILVYECSWRGSITRSPRIAFTITE